MKSHGFIRNDSFPDINLYTMVINVCNGSITCNEHSNFEQIMEYLISPKSNCSKNLSIVHFSIYFDRFTKYF